MEAYNAEAQKAYNGTMPQCACGRTFETAEKLATHAKSCKSGGGKGGGGGTMGADGSDGGVMGGVKGGPRMLVCYLCGTQHGLSSLAIHQKQCAVKREKAQQGLAPSARTAAAPPPPVPVPGPRASMAEVMEPNHH